LRDEGDNGDSEKEAGRRKTDASLVAGRKKLMPKIPSHARPTVLAAAILAALAVFTASSEARAQQVVAFVNGQPITTLDVEHRGKFLQLATKKPVTRKEALDSLIDEILEITEAKRFSVDVPDSEVENSYKNVARHMGLDTDKLTQILTTAGASDDTLKRRLRAQLAWNNLVRGRYKASMEIRDKDVETQLEQRKTDAKNDVGYEYILRPVVLIVPRGSPDAAYEARKRDAEALRSRFANCNDGVAFARALSDVAVRDQVSKYSSDLAQQLRDILDRTAVGHLTPPETTAEGVQMFAICDKKETKSDTPEMHEIRDQMLQQKFGAQAKRYLESLRRAAMIEYKMPDYR
jgi:peptidyl-prolyl cis-trans isomerase SurA